MQDALEFEAPEPSFEKSEEDETSPSGSDDFAIIVYDWLTFTFCSRHGAFGTRLFYTYNPMDRSQSNVIFLKCRTIFLLACFCLCVSRILSYIGFDYNIAAWSYGFDFVYEGENDWGAILPLGYFA